MTHTHIHRHTKTEAERDAIPGIKEVPFRPQPQSQRRIPTQHPESQPNIPKFLFFSHVRGR